jgi:DNA primase
MKHIKKEFITSLLERVDIVDVISSRIHLKRSGSNYSACCPFHSEKTPSFGVNQSKQFFNCFGCHKAGDAIKFIEEFDKVGYVEAVEEVAKIAGVSVEYSDNYSAINNSESLVCSDILETATKLYEQELLKYPKAKEYLHNRGITDETIAKYHIGFAPDEWSFLKSKIGKNDPKVIQKLVELGIVTQNSNGKSYDTFRNRVIIPIRNKTGKTVAFGGRVLDDVKPKYINSRETPLFKKGHELFNLDYVRSIFREELNFIVITEGYMDVIALDQFGVHNAVASLGTATTPYQLELLFRQSDSIIFCYDGDNAGQHAAWHALDTALPAIRDDKKLSFCFLPKEHDPDSFVREYGAVGMKDYLSKAMSLTDYIMSQLALKYRVDVEGDRIRCLDEAFNLILKIGDAHITKQSLLVAVAKLVEWPIDRVNDAYKQKTMKNSVSTGSNTPSSQVGINTNEVQMTEFRSFVALLLQNPYLYNYIPNPDNLLELLKTYSNNKMDILDDLFYKISKNLDVKTGILLGSYAQTKFEKGMDYLASLKMHDENESIEVKVIDLLVLLKHILREAINTRILYLKEKSKKEKLSNSELAESTVLEKRSRDLQLNNL